MNAFKKVFKRATEHQLKYLQAELEARSLEERINELDEEIEDMINEIRQKPGTVRIQKETKQDQQFNDEWEEA